MKVSGLGVKSELHLLAYTTAVSKARDQTHTLTATMLGS